MKYSLGLLARPFNAIKDGTKKIEGRRIENIRDENGRVVQAGDTITFINEESGESMEVDVTFVHNYSDVRTMLETEGVQNVLSSGTDIETGIKNYHSFKGYTESIAKHGIFAIGVRKIEQFKVRE